MEYLSDVSAISFNQELLLIVFTGIVTSIGFLIKDKFFNQPSINLLKSHIKPIPPEQRQSTIQNIYNTPHATIYSTHIEYGVMDQAHSDATKNDWAKHLYTTYQKHVPFYRIISVIPGDDKTIQWISDMLDESVNNMYRIAIVEGESNQLPYPNMVIADSEEIKIAYLSFRSANRDASGAFAFTTEDTVFVNGLIDHIKDFHDSPTSIPAEDYLKKLREVDTDE